MNNLKLTKRFVDERVVKVAVLVPLFLSSPNEPLLADFAHCTLLAINRMDYILERMVLRSPDAKVPGEALTRGKEIDYLPYRRGMTGKDNPVSGDALFVENDNAFPR